MNGSNCYVVEKPLTRERNNFRVPAVDIIETENNFSLMVNVPGVTKENLKVNLKDRQLVIEGTVSENAAEGANYLMRERRNGNFYRKFNLGDSIETDKIDATLENGILTVVLSKKEVAQPKNIVIK